jgi:hypothetical protein
MKGKENFFYNVRERKIRSAYRRQVLLIVSHRMNKKKIKSCWTAEITSLFQPLLELSLGLVFLGVVL